MSQSLHEKLRAFDPELPLARAHTIPASWYWDDEIFRAECASVFGHSWQIAGRAEVVAIPGSYLTADIAGEPVLVVRDEQGNLRAFANVCQHRAAVLVPDACGRVTRLRCRYHGWTYDLQGRLRGTPEFEGVEEFCKEDNGLVALAVAVWGPYVWVNAASAPSLAEYLAPLPERTRGMGLEGLRWAARREYEIDCNWKVYVDNFLDGGYHVHTVHPGLAGALDYANYRTELASHVSVQHSPLRTAEDADIARVRSGDHAAYWWIFPNCMINLYSGVMDMNLVLPLGPERCKVIFDWFFPVGTSDDLIRESIAVSHQVQVEDVAISAEVQRGLRSRSYQTGRYSVRREAGIYHFHQLLARHLSNCRVGSVSDGSEPEA